MIAIAVVVVLVLAVAGAFFGFSYMLKGREAADLRRYLQGENCKWESMAAKRLRRWRRLLQEHGA